MTDENKVKSTVSVEKQNSEPSIPENKVATSKPAWNLNISTQQPTDRVDLMSLKSIQAKKNLQKAQNETPVLNEKFAHEKFTETDMLLCWNKFAQKLEDRGEMIMNSLLMIEKPRLEGTTIIHQLPNDGTKIEFEQNKNELLGYLRGMLHNYDISIEIEVNEAIESKKAFTPEDKYHRLKEINPLLEDFKKAFDLDY